ncbi:MAG TPA: ABC transporter permease [Candidatus Baltobacteraceae bacterium]
MLERFLGVTFDRYVSLVAVLTGRYVKVRYRGSVLGIFWSVLNPLIMTTLYTLIFGKAFRGYYGSSVFDYLFAVFVGLVVMNYFSTATGQALHSIVVNGLLLNKMRVPFSVFPIATVISNSVQFVVGVIPLLVIIALVVAHNPLGIPFLIPPLIALALVTVGVSMFVAAAYVFFRDVPHIYELVTFAIFIATPVFYPIGIVDPRFRPLVQWSPLSLIVQQIRDVVVTHQLPPPTEILASLAWGIVIFVGGWAVFVRSSRRFMDYL